MEKTYQRIIFALKTLKKLACSLVLLSVFLNFNNAHALSLISDEETEVFLHQTLRPIFKAADVTFYPEHIYIVNDNSLNAFVSEGNRMFVHIGTLISAESQNEISGVLAHETGHIQGGHILRHKIQAQEVQNVSLASMLVGGLAGVATGHADLSMAAILGSQSSAINSMLKYQISEERSADNAAIKILQKINQSPAGMLKFMQRIKDRNRLEGITEHEYYRTHPMTDERIGFLEEAVKNSHAQQQGLQEQAFQRIKAKLFAYTNTPQNTFIRYPFKDKSIPARYARTIAYYKQADMGKAQKEIDDLIKDEPNNPYFYELKGQMFIENGHLKEAIKAYQKALELNPSSSLFKLNLAQATLEDTPSRQELKQIVIWLNQILIHNTENPLVWLLLSRAYGELEDHANSYYAAAEFSLSHGDINTAQRQADMVLNARPSATLKLKTDDLVQRIKQIEQDKLKKNH